MLKSNLISYTLKDEEQLLTLVSHPAPRKCEAVTRGRGLTPETQFVTLETPSREVRGQFSGPRMIN